MAGNGGVRSRVFIANAGSTPYSTHSGKILASRVNDLKACAPRLTFWNPLCHFLPKPAAAAPLPSFPTQMPVKPR
jgi:hypothetical protein